MVGFLLTIGIFIGFLIGLVIGMSPQIVINQFEKPVCVEQTVGKDTIKKCYELKEVK